MTLNTVALLIGILGACAFLAGRGRARATARSLGGIRHLDALPHYYGTQTALWCALPALVLLGAWLAFRDPLINSVVMGEYQQQVDIDSLAEYNLNLATISNVASGVLDPTSVSDAVVAASQHMAALQSRSNQLVGYGLVALCLCGLVLGWFKVSATGRARQSVERTLQ